MASRAWKHRKLIGVAALDKDGFELRLYLKTWQDNSQCFEVQKWAEKNGRMTPYWPLQSVQIPVGSVPAIALLVAQMELNAHG